MLHVSQFEKSSMRLNRILVCSFGHLSSNKQINHSQDRQYAGSLIKSQKPTQNHLIIYPLIHEAKVKDHGQVSKAIKSNRTKCFGLKRPLF